MITAVGEAALDRCDGDHEICDLGERKVAAGAVPVPPGSERVARRL
jgi:hypothetical protein